MQTHPPDAPTLRPLATMAEQRDAARKGLMMLPWLQPLSAPLLEVLARQGRVRWHPRNAIVFGQGDEAQELSILLAGHVHIVRQAPGKPPALLQVVRPFDCMGDTAVLDGEPLAGEATAVKPSVVLTLPRQVVVDALRQQPEFAERFSAQLSRRLREANDRVRLLARCPVEERVLLVLRQWAARNAAGQWVVDEPIGQRELAMVVAASREMTSRALAQLRLKGLITTDGWRQVVLAESTN